MPDELPTLILRRMAHAAGTGPKPEARVPGDAPVSIGHDRWVPPEWRGTIRDDGAGEAGLYVTLDIVLDRTTPRAERVSLQRADGQPLTSRDLKSTPLDRWVRMAVEQKAERANAGDDHAAIAKRLGMKPPIRRRLTDDHLEDVARVYREALAAGQPPTEAVRRELGLTRPTAGRHVMLARERGHLGPAENRKSGETQEGKQ